MNACFFELARFEQSIRPQPDPFIDEFVEAFSSMVNSFAVRQMKIDMAFGQTLKDGDYTLCWATHPKMPNRSGHSRSRTHHLTTDRKVTLCKMKFDRVGKEGFERGLCYNCRTIRERLEAKKEAA